ncbi:MAG: FmdB family zinc ribbon protein [bacterium]
MPIYEYQCQKCGTFEVNQRITESPVRRCPSCKGKVTKLISQTSFHLKGSGWYATDYASKGNGQKDAAEDKKPEAAGKSDAAKPESGKSGSGESKSSSSGKTEATAA